MPEILIGLRHAWRSLRRAPARAALRQVDSRVAMGDVRTMEQIVGDLLRPQWASSASSRAP
jgi:hypothetical protein